MTSNKTMSESDRILKLPEVQSLTTLSRSTVYQMMKEGKFPRSIPLGTRAVGWRLSAINKWIDQQEESVREVA